MRLFIIIASCIVLTLFILWVIGPRVIIRTPPKAIPTIPDDIDGYLKNRETKPSEAIKKGLEAQVIWAHEDKQKTAYSIVYLHGFSSSRGELSPIMETVAKKLGANLFFTRFRGHGSESGNLLKKTTPNDWLEDALEARAIGERIGDKLILVGTSHGGLLASWVASQPGFRREAEAVVLVSPNFAPKDRRTQLLTLPWARQLLPLIFGRYRDWDPKNSGHEYYWNTVYPTHALFIMMAQVHYITPTSAQKLKTPTLVLYSTKDNTVDSTLIEEKFHQCPATPKKLVEIMNSGDPQHHILGGDVLSPETTDTVIQNIKGFLEELGITFTDSE